MFTHDEYSPEGYAEREARDEAISLASLDLPPEPDDNLISESDVIGGYDPDAELEAAWGAFMEDTYDPDYPLGR